MLEIKLEDFEKHRKLLIGYATSLLKSKAQSVCLIEEIDELAKDIVQNTYLMFHNSNLKSFVSEKHLENYLKICLYHAYQHACFGRSKLIQYNLKKDWDADLSKIKLINSQCYYMSNYSFLEQFLKTLNEESRNVLEMLLKGYSVIEISKKYNFSKGIIYRKIKNIREEYKKFDDDREFIKVKRATKSILQCYLDGKIKQEWVGIYEAARSLELTESGICMNLKGKRKQYRGWIWKYK